MDMHLVSPIITTYMVSTRK